MYLYPAGVLTGVIIFQDRGFVTTLGSNRHGVMFCLLLHVREGVTCE